MSLSTLGAPTMRSSSWTGQGESQTGTTGAWHGVLYFKGRQDPIFYDRALEETRRTFWQPGELEYEYDIQLLVGAIRVQKEAYFQNIGQSAQAAEERRKAQEAFAQFRNADARKDWKLADELRRMPFAKTDAAKANLDHWVDGLKKARAEVVLLNFSQRPS